MDISEIHWLPEEEYERAVGQVRLQLNEIMRPLMLYGQAPYVYQAINEIIKITEDFGLRVRGIDHPIDIELVRQDRK